VTVERVLRVLDRAGFRGQDLLDAANAYIGYVAGYIALELSIAGQPLDPDTGDQIRDRFGNLDPQLFPLLTAHADELTDRVFGCRVEATQLETGFWFGLERLIDGFQAHLSRTGKAKARPRRRRPRATTSHA
jgi:hypothetical protein